MKRILCFIFILTLTMMGNSAVAATASSGTKHIFEATLSGRNEVPPIVSNTTGHLKVTIPNGEGSLDYILTVNNGRQITAAHLHCGAEGQNGSVVVDLYKNKTSSYSANSNGVLSQGVINRSSIVTTSQNCPQRIDTVEHLVQSMRDGNIYVNVHTTAHPDGEIRGQLVATYDSTGYLIIGTTTTSVQKAALVARLQSLLQQLSAMLARLNTVR